ncbi:MAG: hypothetical protein FWD18_07790 [Micrococcales bacterium]|nr:hypothetical protein [Micrococcales bacterium]
MTTIRKGSRTKAAISTAAALAMLIGGASTFARWVEEDERELDAIAISTGWWEWDIKQTEEWYDVSPEITDQSDGWDSDAEGVPISLATFLMVPGDVIKGVIEVEIDDLVTHGVHLDAVVSAIDEGDVAAEAAVSWLDVSAAINGDGNLEITIEFPYSDGAPTHAGDYESQSQLTGVAVDLGSLKVTVTQVRPYYDGP